MGAAAAVAAGCVLVVAGSARDAASSSTIEGRWAYLLRDVAALERPRPGSRTVAMLATATPEGESNLVTVLERRRDAALTEWARVRLAYLPNGRTGWVPRAALGELHVVRTRLVIDRNTLLATLYRNGRTLFRAPIGVGEARYPTPAGEFYVRVRLLGFGNRFYGPVAFGTSARSETLTDWPGGGFIGIHGTDRPELLPGRVSHGCVRLRNADILRLARLMPLGTPVTIR